MRRSIIRTFDYLVGVLNQLRPIAPRGAGAPPMAMLPAERVPGIGMFARLRAIITDPTALAVRCMEHYRRPFTVRIPFFFDLTYLPGKKGLRFVLDMDPEVGRMGPVMKRVPTVGYWFPKSDDGEAHLQDLLLSARAFMAGQLFRAERLAQVEDTARATMRGHIRNWDGKVDLAKNVVRAIYDASLRCMIGDDLWHRLADEVARPLRAIANGIDIPRTTLSVMPFARLLPEYRATRKLARILKKVVAEHDASGRYELIDQIRAMEVGGAPIPEDDVPWMLMYILWNSVTYPGSYGLWAYLDMVTRPGLLASIRYREDDRVLEHAFMETLRMNPVASLVRETVEEVEFESDGETYRIPAGGYVGTSTWALNYDPETYDEPASFNAGRFASGEPLPHAFGRGAFGCPAGKFTRLLMRAVHGELVDGLNVRLEGALPDRRSRVHLTYPDRPILAQVSQRVQQRPQSEIPTMRAEIVDRIPARCPFHRNAA